MTPAIFIKYLHILSILIVCASIAIEFSMIKPKMQYQELRKLAFVDAIYGVSALMAVIFGLLLWFAVGKPATFYTGNYLFYLKIALFGLVGILSLRPTIYLLKLRKQIKFDDIIELPSDLKKIIAIELIIMAFIPLLATLMSVGIGK